jgi:hypothetical protein
MKEINFLDLPDDILDYIFTLSRNEMEKEYNKKKYSMVLSELNTFIFTLNFKMYKFGTWGEISILELIKFKIQALEHTHFFIE